jgi:hypothetical protein
MSPNEMREPGTRKAEAQSKESKMSVSLLNYRAQQSNLAKEIEKAKRRLRVVPRIDVSVLNKLCRLSTVYDGADSQLKTKLLQALFPNGKV